MHLFTHLILLKLDATHCSASIALQKNLGHLPVDKGVDIHCLVPLEQAIVLSKFYMTPPPPTLSFDFGV